MVSAQQRLQNDIDYLVRHQELDKFNYNQANTLLLGVAPVFISLWVFLITYANDKNDLGLMITSTLILFVFGGLAVLFLSMRAEDANQHFMTREDMLWMRYNKIGMYKKSIEKEFEILRNKKFGNRLVPHYIVKILGLVLIMFGLLLIVFIFGGAYASWLYGVVVLIVALISILTLKKI